MTTSEPLASLSDVIAEIASGHRIVVSIKEGDLEQLPPSALKLELATLADGLEKFPSVVRVNLGNTLSRLGEQDAAEIKEKFARALVGSPNIISVEPKIRVKGIEPEVDLEYVCTLNCARSHRLIRLLDRDQIDSQETTDAVRRLPAILFTARNAWMSAAGLDRLVDLAEAAATHYQVPFKRPAYRATIEPRACKAAQG